MWSGPVARRRASGTMTIRWWASVARRQYSISDWSLNSGCSPPRRLVGLARSGEHAADRTDVEHGGPEAEQVIHGGASAVEQVQGDALGDGDAGLLDASVGCEEDWSGGGDRGLVAVANQAGEPVVG